MLPEVQAYRNQDVLEHFQESCDLLERVTIAKTCSMPSDHVQTFAEMTPLFFHANTGFFGLDFSDAINRCGRTA